MAWRLGHGWVLLLWAGAVSATQAAPPATLSGTYSGVMHCNMAAVSFTVTIVPRDEGRVEFTLSGEQTQLIPGKAAGAQPATATATGSYDAATGAFKLQQPPGSRVWITAWQGVVLAGGERLVAAPSDPERSACTGWAAARGAALPAEWQGVVGEVTAGMATATAEGAQAYARAMQSAGETAGCPPKIKEWLGQLAEHGLKSQPRQANPVLRNLFREPEFSRRFGSSFAAMPRDERLALAGQIGGACKRDPSVSLLVSQNSALVSPLLNFFNLPAADVRASLNAIDAARRWRSELDGLVAAALRDEQAVPRLDALSIAAQPVLGLLWPDEREAFNAELRGKRLPLLRAYLEAQLAADEADPNPWPRLNNFHQRFAPVLRDLSEADAAAVRELHARKLAAAQGAHDQQHALRVAEAEQQEAQRRAALPPAERVAALPPGARRSGDAARGTAATAAPAEVLPPASGPFKGPGAPYVNALYQDDARRLNAMDAQFARPIQEQMAKLSKFTSVFGKLVGAQGLVDGVNQRNTAAVAEMSMALFMAESFMVSYEYIFPPSCMDAEPLQYKRTIEHSGSVARNLYGAELWRTPGWTERRYYRVNNRFKATFEASGANDGTEATTFDAIFKEPGSVALSDALDSMRQGMRGMACDSAEMKRFEANLFKRFWAMKTRIDAVLEGKAPPR